MLNQLREFCPTPASGALGALSGLTMFLFAGWLAASCRRRGLRAGDTRKLFHFCIFNAAALLRWQSDAGCLVVFGSTVALGIFLVTWRGPGNGVFDALARPSDAPRQRLHVISPLLCTAVGGVAAQLIAGRLAIIAYLIGGWGDAIGEPVGIRWGKHQYTVPSLGGIPAKRSLEGSLAVFMASAIAAALGLSLVGYSGGVAFGVACLFAFVTTTVEAVSPHGLDNLTILIAAALVANWCMT
ncbi:MAG: dolichol kinase [Planctomycetaceae bacterium]|nr:dolichol kinase [Planctomycetaceae bacterium]